MKIRIIGIGSAIAGDDAVGLAVIRELSRMTLPNDVELVEAGTPGMSLLELMVGAEKVILVDAFLGGNCPGKARKLKVTDLAKKNGRINSVHEIGVVEAIMLAQDLIPEKLPSQIVIVGVEVSEQFGFGKGLSQEVKDALPEAVQMVMSEI